MLAKRTTTLTSTRICDATSSTKKSVAGVSDWAREPASAIWWVSATARWWEPPSEEDLAPRTWATVSDVQWASLSESSWVSWWVRLLVMQKATHSDSRSVSERVASRDRGSETQRVRAWE